MVQKYKFGKPFETEAGHSLCGRNAEVRKH